MLIPNRGIILELVFKSRSHVLMLYTTQSRRYDSLRVIHGRAITISGASTPSRSLHPRSMSLPDSIDR